MAKKYQVVIKESNKEDVNIGQPFDTKAQAHEFAKDCAALLKNMEYGTRWPEIKEVEVVTQNG